MNCSNVLRTSNPRLDSWRGYKLKAIHVVLTEAAGLAEYVLAVVFLVPTLT